MRIYAAGRQWGKTTLLIRKSVETGKTIVAPNEEMVRAIVMRTDALRLTIPYPITFREFISKGRYDGAGYLIDELQSCLKQLNVTDATVDIDAVGYMQDPNDFIREKIYESVEKPKQKEKESETMSKPKRISKSEYYLNIAKAVAQRSTCIRRQYGAVIVKNDEIIATGYNGSARGEENCCDIGTCWRERNNIPHGQQYEKCVAVHAEQNAIISAPRDKLLGSTIYIYGEENGKAIEARPCEICHRMILNAGIENIVLSEPGDDMNKKTEEEAKGDDQVTKSFIRNVAEKIEGSGLKNVRVNLSFEPYKCPMCTITVNDTHSYNAGFCGYRMDFDPLYEGFEDLDRMIVRDVERGLNKILEKSTQK